jgi:hypothetical protein
MLRIARKPQTMLAKLATMRPRALSSKTDAAPAECERADATAHADPRAQLSRWCRTF